MTSNLEGAHPPSGGPCCGSSRRVSILDYIERGMRMNRSEPLAVVGKKVSAPDGVMAQFSLRLDDDVIESASFKVSFCTTLIAYCAVLSEWATGATLQRAARIPPADLAAALVGVPPQKRDRAVIAKAALLSAIQKALEGDSK